MMDFFPNSLTLVGKVNGHEVMLLRVSLFMYWTLWNVSAMSSDICGYYWTLQKLLALSGFKCDAYKLKKVGRYTHCIIIIKFTWEKSTTANATRINTEVVNHHQGRWGECGLGSWSLKMTTFQVEWSNLRSKKLKNIINYIFKAVKC